MSLLSSIKTLLECSSLDIWFKVALHCGTSHDFLATPWASYGSCGHDNQLISGISCNCPSLDNIQGQSGKDAVWVELSEQQLVFNFVADWWGYTKPFFKDINWWNFISLLAHVWYRVKNSNVIRPPLPPPFPTYPTTVSYCPAQVLISLVTSSIDWKWK